MKDLRREIHDLRLGTFLLSLGLFINPTVFGISLAYIAFAIGIILVYKKAKDLAPYTDKFEKIRTWMIVSLVVCIVSTIGLGILNADPASAVNTADTIYEAQRLLNPITEFKYYIVGWVEIPVGLVMYGCLFVSYFYILQGLEDVTEKTFSTPAKIHVDKAKKGYKAYTIIFLVLFVANGLINILYLNYWNNFALGNITEAEYYAFSYKISIISFAYSIFDIIVWAKSLRINKVQKILTNTAVIPDPFNQPYQESQYQQPSQDAIKVDAKVTKEEKVENDFHKYDDEIK